MPSSSSWKSHSNAYIIHQRIADAKKSSFGFRRSSVRLSLLKYKYNQKALLNGKELNTFHFPARELLKGDSLILEMGDTPNEMWGAL